MNKMPSLTIDKSYARVGVAVVNWNSGKQLLDCVTSVLNSSVADKIEIVVVDNNSHDTSMLMIEHLDAVKKVYAGENLGFGKACNLASAELQTEFLLFLNPDACVCPETIEQVVNFMDSSQASKIGICGVQLLDESNQVARSCARLPTPASFFYQALGALKISKLQMLGSRMAEWDHQDSRIVGQLIGAFFFVRQKVFRGLGGFDEQYFVYFEEVDFSLRAEQAGWSSFY